MNMVRLRNREVTKKPSKNVSPDDDFDPVRLYQRYIHNLQITPKPKEACPPSGGGKAKKQLPRSATPLRAPGNSPTPLTAKLSKTKTRVRSKPSLEIQTSRLTNRPKTAQTKKKPVDNLEEYEVTGEKKVTFEPNEIECFFDALKETVEEVVEVKLSNMVQTVVDTLTKKIEDASNKSHKLEQTLTTLCNELNNKIMYYGEEHSRHFRYICMKLEYDKIFYQHINNLMHPDQPKSNEEPPVSIPQSTASQSHIVTTQPQSVPSQAQTILIQPQPVMAQAQSSPSHQHQLPHISHSKVQQTLNLFESAPTCSHSQRPQSCRPQQQQQPQQCPGQDWAYQAGDSAKNPPVSQTARPFSHSSSGPFHRVAAPCQGTRSCPKQMDTLMTNLKEYNEDMEFCKCLGQTKSVDVTFVSTGVDNKAQLGIKEFLDTLKVFQSNLSGKDILAKGDLKMGDDMSLSKQNSALSLMDTDDSSSECCVSNGISLISSGGNTTPVVEKN